MTPFKNIKYKVLLNDEQVEAKVYKLAGDINWDYAGKELVAILVMNGAFIFGSDLLKEVLVEDLYVGFIKLSSYGEDFKSSGNVQYEHCSIPNLTGKHVLVIEDIVDSGNTWDFLKRHLQKQDPASLRICTFISKPNNREVEVTTDYVGYILNDNKFVIGYGLDYKGYARNWPYVAEIVEGQIYEGQ